MARSLLLAALTLACGAGAGAQETAPEPAADEAARAAEWRRDFERSRDPAERGRLAERLLSQRALRIADVGIFHDGVELYHRQRRYELLEGACRRAWSDAPHAGDAAEPMAELIGWCWRGLLDGRRLDGAADLDLDRLRLEAGDDADPGELAARAQGFTVAVLARRRTASGDLDGAERLLGRALDEQGRHLASYELDGRRVVVEAARELAERGRPAPWEALIEVQRRTARFDAGFGVALALVGVVAAGAAAALLRAGVQAQRTSLEAADLGGGLFFVGVAAVAEAVGATLIAVGAGVSRDADALARSTPAAVGEHAR